MTHRAVLILLSLLASTFAALSPLAAQQPPEKLQQAGELRVVTRVLPPMVTKQNEGYSGFSIELWEEIARRLNLKYRLHEAPNVRAQLADVRDGKADVGIAAISITSAREQEFGFSQPMMNAGLQIMVAATGKDASPTPLQDLLKLLFSYTSLAWLGIAAILVLIPAHIIWFFERTHHEGVLPTEKYIPGIFHAIYWASATVLTQGENAPRHWVGRIMAIIWMFTGVVFVALYTAQLTADLTVQQITSSINGPNDLAGKRVATTAGSTAAAAVRDYNARVIEFSDIREAFQSLNNKDADAVVFDSPILLYYAANEGKGRVATVGTTFRKEDYGIVFQRDNQDLRRRVNVALLQMREDGTYQRIHDKWFASR
ncbi:MAG: hypothetical protein RLZ98_2658 [Pseudomonadota bacterium]|jgi:polar amino acid transport system substrate-binding protein